MTSQNTISQQFFEQSLSASLLIYRGAAQLQDSDFQDELGWIDLLIGLGFGLTQACANAEGHEVGEEFLARCRAASMGELMETLRLAETSGQKSMVAKLRYALATRRLELLVNEVVSG